MEVLQALGLLVVFVLVLVLAYFTTKWVGKRYGGGAAGGMAGNIRVVDRVTLGPDWMLCIVEAAGKTMLLGVTQQRIEKLCDVEASELLPPRQGDTAPFAAALKNALDKGWGIGKGSDKPGKEEEPHD